MQGSLAVAGEDAATSISAGVTANQMSIVSRGKSAMCLVRKAKAMRSKAGGAPRDQRGHGLAMDRDAPPAPVHAADLGQQPIKDDRHGGSNHIVLGAAGSLPLDRQEQSGGDAQGVTKSIPCPPK